jgi:quercetin dioxygenase-like cupin family protein
MTTQANLSHSFTYDSAQINVYLANKGEGLPRHQHIYSHATICHNGSCLVILEGRNYTIDKNSQPLNLPANEWHEIEALEDDTVFVNIFAEGKS